MTELKTELPIEHRLKLRNLRLSDYEDIRQIMDLVYPPCRAPGPGTVRFPDRRFPEGQICIEDNGWVIAAAMSLIVDYSRYGDRHTYEQITGNGYLTTHDPSGDTLYGMDLFVHPEYRNLRLGRRLYDARKELCEKLNLRAIVVGGRIPGYWKYSQEMSPSSMWNWSRPRKCWIRF